MDTKLYTTIFTGCIQQNVPSIRLKRFQACDWFVRTANFYRRCGTDPIIAAKFEISKLDYTKDRDGRERKEKKAPAGRSSRKSVKFCTNRAIINLD